MKPVRHSLSLFLFLSLSHSSMELRTMKCSNVEFVLILNVPNWQLICIWGMTMFRLLRIKQSYFANKMFHVLLGFSMWKWQLMNDEMEKRNFCMHRKKLHHVTITRTQSWQYTWQIDELCATKWFAIESTKNEENKKSEERRERNVHPKIASPEKVFKLTKINLELKLKWNHNAFAISFSVFENCVSVSAFRIWWMCVFLLCDYVACNLPFWNGFLFFCVSSVCAKWLFVSTVIILERKIVNVKIVELWNCGETASTTEDAYTYKGKKTIFNPKRDN